MSRNGVPDAGVLTYVLYPYTCDWSVNTAEPFRVGPITQPWSAAASLTDGDVDLVEEATVPRGGGGPRRRWPDGSHQMQNGYTGYASYFNGDVSDVARGHSLGVGRQPVQRHQLGFPARKIGSAWLSGG